MLGNVLSSTEHVPIMLVSPSQMLLQPVHHHSKHCITKTYAAVSRGRDAKEGAEVAEDRHLAADDASMHAASRYSRRPAAGPKLYRYRGAWWKRDG